jgi:hypothetical protein
MYKNICGTLVAGGPALSFATMGVATLPATSAPSYDGLWSVVIITEKGACENRFLPRQADGSCRG